MAQLQQLLASHLASTLRTGIHRAVCTRRKGRDMFWDASILEFPHVRERPVSIKDYYLYGAFLLPAEHVTMLITTSSAVDEEHMSVRRKINWTSDLQGQGKRNFCICRCPTTAVLWSGSGLPLLRCRDVSIVVIFMAQVNVVNLCASNVTLGASSLCAQGARGTRQKCHRPPCELERNLRLV